MDPQSDNTNGNGAVEMTDTSVATTEDSHSPSAVAPDPWDVGEASLPHPEEIKGKLALEKTNRTSKDDNDDEGLSRGKRMYIALAVTLAIFLLVVIPLATTDRTRRDEKRGHGSHVNSNSTILTHGADSDVYDPLRNSKLPEVMDYLTKRRVSDANVIVTVGTPQYKAALWLAEKDGYNLPIPIDKRRSLLEPVARRRLDAIAPPTNEERQTEAYHYKYIVRYVMALNYFALAGDQWSGRINFLSHRDVCFWTDHVAGLTSFLIRGVICKNSQGPPQQLLLGHMAATGKIPTENGLLTSLTLFDIQSSLLTGTIPSELCNLKSLDKILLSHNDLTGSLPSCIGQLVNLKSLQLHNNMLTGSLPSSMGSLSALETLVLEKNNFTGNPISVWGGMHNLTLLYADRNNFTGALDNTFLLHHNALQALDLSHNEFSLADGVLPTRLFTFRGLVSLDLSNNPLNGTIPVNLIGNRENKIMKFVSLHDTNMFGPLAQMKGLMALEHLDLSENKFSGPIHSELGHMVMLQSLFLSINDDLTPGTVPSFLAGLTQLRDLSLRDTNMEGPIPSFLATSFPHLTLLDLGNNRFNGTIPTEFSNLTSLKHLLLNGNSITGGIEPLLNLTGLSVLLVDGTDLRFTYNCATGPDTLTLYATCNNIQKEDEERSKVVCGCCECCFAGTTGCSNPLLARIDASRAGFNRSEYDFGGKVKLNSGAP